MIVPLEAAVAATIAPTPSKTSAPPKTSAVTPVAAKKQANSSVSSPPPRSVVSVAATKMIKIGMQSIESRSHPELLCEVLQTLAQWRYGDDSALPLLVKALEHEDEMVRRRAVAVIQFVNLLGPNVYYNERVLLLLESIGRKERALRVDVCSCFVALGMDNEFVRQLLVSCISQSEDPAMQVCFLLCFFACCCVVFLGLICRRRRACYFSVLSIICELPK